MELHGGSFVNIERHVSSHISADIVHDVLKCRCPHGGDRTVHSVVTPCWLAYSIHQFTVMDRADVCIAEVTTDQEATVQVFAFEDHYRVCNVLQQSLLCDGLWWIIESRYNKCKTLHGAGSESGSLSTCIPAHGDFQYPDAGMEL